jgi:hypothetical protein|tara:strand:- start:862 stop:1284 length:423 start_codon:yes stop_codon:yes gene_type:complete
MCVGGFGPMGAQHEGTTHYLDRWSNLTMDGRPVTSDMKEFGKHQAGDTQMFFLPVSALERIAQAKERGALDGYGNRVIQPGKSPSPGVGVGGVKKPSGQVRGKGKSKGKRQTSGSSTQGKDKRGDLLVRGNSGNKTLLGA